MPRVAGLIALALVALGAGAGAACGPGQVNMPNDTGLDGLAIDAVAPGALIPGSSVVVLGKSFVDAPWGRTQLRLTGTLDGAPTDVRLDAIFVGYGELRVQWPGGLAAGLPADSGSFTGEAVLEVDSTVDGELHRSAPRSLTLQIATHLEPSVAEVQTGVIFVNDPIEVAGGGFLLGGDEGETVAVVDGCFTPDGEVGCTPQGTTEVPARPADPFDRSRVIFAFDPRIAGIQSGRFEGTVKLVNRHGASAGGSVTESAVSPATYDIVPPRIFSIAPTTASLGQYVDVDGGGFVGLPPGSPNQETLLTLVELDGIFTPTGAPGGAAVTLQVVPEFEYGRRLRYVLNEEDDLGQRIDLRSASGTFVGTARPIVKFGLDEVVGDASNVTLSIASVKQVVWLNFLPSYVESLRHFGLRGVDSRIRARVMEVAERDYEGIHIEFRFERPEDFAYFAQVDIGGPDPNGLGLLGYDNSPGKDINNVRLYDKIGGVNATTQDDGYPGYGGVFVESFFGFSRHPGDFAVELAGGSDPVFDEIFDPFRPDLGGAPVLAGDLADVPVLTSGDSCPSPAGRGEQIACAIWVLGSMIGTTMTHEVGHSLGLANPQEEMNFHNTGDAENRLMDAGGARTFYERAELMGQGPAVFCDGDYAYLREILPSPAPPSTVARPSCF